MRRGSAVIERGEIVRGNRHICIIDIDQPCRIFGNIGRLGDDAGDGLSDIADFAIGKRRRAGRQFERTGGLLDRHHCIGQVRA